MAVSEVKVKIVLCLKVPAVEMYLRIQIIKPNVFLPSTLGSYIVIFTLWLH
jgi:hypothetical protein